MEIVVLKELGEQVKRAQRKYSAASTYNHIYTHRFYALGKQLINNMEEGRSIDVNFLDVDELIDVAEYLENTPDREILRLLTSMDRETVKLGVGLMREKNGRH